MDINEAFSIVFELAASNALDPELHSDMSEEIERQEQAFTLAVEFLAQHSIKPEFLL